MMTPIDQLFPYKNSTIGTKEIADILRTFDLDGNKIVTKMELLELFEGNKQWIGALY